MLTVIVPIYNEELYIARCLDSILAQDYPQDQLEVLLIDGMSNDHTRDIVARYAATSTFIRIIDNPRRIVPAAMNLGIQEAKGNVIIRLDAHVIFPVNYFSELVKHLEILNADNVGAVCRTLPANAGVVARSIAHVLSSSFGMGNSYFRTGVTEVKEVDTVPFGCFRRSLFSQIGGFDEELIRNQDDEFNGRIIKHGGKIYLLPHLVVDYYARDTEMKVFRMFYQYGLFKPLVNKKLGAPATMRQFVPPLFVLGILSGPLLVLVSPLFGVLYAIVVVLYFFLALYFSCKGAKKTADVLCRCYTYCVVHFAYGLGYWVGVFKLICRRKLVVDTNR